MFAHLPRDCWRWLPIVVSLSACSIDQAPIVGPEAPARPATTLSVATLPTPVQTTYVSFYGSVLTRYAWVGRNIAILTESDALDRATMGRILEVFDGVYDYYAAAVGATPISYRTYAGKLSIAQVPSTCGAGCAYVGYTGIEMLTSYFQLLYDGVRLRDEWDQVLFYEFGRNFWLMGGQLEYKAPEKTASVVTGFAVTMRITSMLAVGAQGAPYGRLPFKYFKDEVAGLSFLYERDPRYTLQNTLFLDVGLPNHMGLGAADLFSSFIFRLMRESDGLPYVSRLWHAARARPAAVTTQDAVDNFVISASIAAARNLGSRFTTTWRWTLSPQAVAELSALFP